MKRKIAIVMVSVLTVFTLAACGNKENTNTDTSTNTNTEAPVVAEPIESVAEESVVTEPSVEQDTEDVVYREIAPGTYIIVDLDMATAEKYHLECSQTGAIVLDGDTPTEVLEALLDEEELGQMHFYVESKYYVDPEDPEFRQEIQDVLVKNEELAYSNN